MVAKTQVDLSFASCDKKETIARLDWPTLGQDGSSARGLRAGATFVRWPGGRACALCCTQMGHIWELRGRVGSRRAETI